MVSRALLMGCCVAAFAGCGADAVNKPAGATGGSAGAQPSVVSATAGTLSIGGSPASNPGRGGSAAPSSAAGSITPAPASGGAGATAAVSNGGSPAAAVGGQPATAAAGMSAGMSAQTPGNGSAMVQIDNPAPKPSMGCGMAAPMAGNASIDVMGTSRDYILSLPQGYDPSKPYRLIFAWHGLGGSAQQVASNWYGLSRMAQNSTIFVAGQGLMTMTNVGNGAGWPNTNGQDVAFVKALYARLQSQLCFDETRVFSTGMSYGGIMSNTLGCQMGDVIRAIAPMSGSGPGFGGRAMCVGQVAVWSSHGDNDTVVATASGEASRDFWVKANHCQTQTVMVDPSPCVSYTGCDVDSPVTFCEFAGGHTVPPFAAAAIWKFFSQF